MLKAQIHVDMENTEALVKKLKKASVSGFVVGIPGDAKNSETGKLGLATEEAFKIANGK